MAKDTNYLDLFLEGVIGCKNDHEKQVFLGDIGRLPSNIHETKKYDDLWREEDSKKSNAANQMSVDKLCRALSRTAEASESESDGDESHWVSYDESSSDDANDETTEVENVIDLADTLAKLETELA